MLFAAIGLSLIEFVLNPINRPAFPLRIWLPWLAWITVSFCWLEKITYKNLQDALQLGAPIVLALVGSIFITSELQLGRLIRAYFWAAGFLTVFVAIWAGGILDHREESAINIAIRPLALTSIVVGGLSIAGTRKNRLYGWGGWLLCLGLSIITGSRMASVTLLVLPILNPTDGRFLRKAIAGVVVVIGALALFATPIMQQRFFYTGTGELRDVWDGDFDSAGRFEAWPLIAEQAVKHPWMGHGVGSVAAVVASVWVDQVHPHNDYLRVAYELGGIGLVVFLCAAAWQLWDLYRQIGRTDGTLQQAFAGAWLGLTAFLFIAITDNPIMYTLNYMNPVFVLMGAAYKVARCEEAVPSSGRVARRPVPIGPVVPSRWGSGAGAAR